jgi:hypothetical protein
MVAIAAINTTASASASRSEASARALSSSGGRAGARRGWTRHSLHCDEVERMLDGWGYKVERVS